MDNINLNLIFSVISIILILVFGMIIYKKYFSHNSSQKNSSSSKSSASKDAVLRQIPAANDLIIEVLSEGNGDPVKWGHSIEVHYTGWLTSGTQFDSSLKRGVPFKFTVGNGKVIKGWEEGVKGMKVGEKRKLKIPPALGYGGSGAGGVIPPNATLIFHIELLKIH
jgi:FKBP-type peptidyl-prolyl cis-trans isomerase